MTVGGGSDGEEADDLIVRDLPPGYLTFRVDGERVVAALPSKVDETIENPIYAAVRVDDERPFANSVAVENGETFPLIPARRQKITDRWSIPILRNLNAQTTMYPVRFLGGAGERGQRALVRRRLLSQDALPDVHGRRSESGRQAVQPERGGDRAEPAAQVRAVPSRLRRSEARRRSAQSRAGAALVSCVVRERAPEDRLRYAGRRTALRRRASSGW